MVLAPWQETAKIAQDLRDKSIAEVQPTVPDVPTQLPLNVTGLPGQLLTAAEVKITETPPETLIARLAAGELTSVEVTKAFLRRAGLAQKLVRLRVLCLTPRCGVGSPSFAQL